jgi:hypothetical protein
LKEGLWWGKVDEVGVYKLTFTNTDLIPYFALSDFYRRSLAFFK